MPQNDKCKPEERMIVREREREGMTESKRDKSLTVRVKDKDRGIERRSV